MSAVSAILNPATANTDRQRVFLFSSASKNHTLMLHQYEMNGMRLQGGRGDGERQPPVAPVISHPSSLVTMEYDSTVHVYGVVLIGDAKDPEPVTALLSPVFELINPEVTVPNGLIAGCTHESFQWTFFQTHVFFHPPVLEFLLTAWGRLDQNGKEGVIKQNKISPTSTTISGLTAEDVLDKTWLAAFHDGVTPWVVYQTTENRVAVFHVNDEDRTEVHKDGKKFKANTTLAASFIPRKEYTGTWSPSATTLGRVFIYFIYEENGKKDTLYRTWADIESDETHPKFKKEHVRVGEQATQVQASSQISVVADPANQCNWVYVLLEGSNKVSAVKDSWAKQ